MTNDELKGKLRKEWHALNSLKVGVRVEMLDGSHRFYRSYSDGTHDWGWYHMDTMDMDAAIDVFLDCYDTCPSGKRHCQKEGCEGCLEIMKQDGTPLSNDEVTTYLYGPEFEWLFYTQEK